MQKRGILLVIITLAFFTSCRIEGWSNPWYPFTLDQRYDFYGTWKYAEAQEWAIYTISKDRFTFESFEEPHQVYRIDNWEPVSNSVIFPNWSAPFYVGYPDFSRGYYLTISIIDDDNLFGLLYNTDVYIFIHDNGKYLYTNPGLSIVKKQIY